MKTKKWKITLLFSLIVGSFISMKFPFHNSSEEMPINAVAAEDKYKDYNWDMSMGAKLPSQLHYINENQEDDATPDFDETKGIHLSKGGSPTWSNSKSTYGKKNIHFKLFENVRVEFCLYSEGNKKFLIYDRDKGDKILTQDVNKQMVIVTYEFTGIGAAGKEFQIAGNSSDLYLQYIEFGASEKARFNANGGQFSDGTSMKTVVRTDDSSDAVTPPENPTRSENGKDYIFAGWSENPNSSETTTSFEFGKTYFAVWRSSTGITIFLDAISVMLKPLETHQLTVTTLPMTTGIQFNWQSSNPQVATVDQTGLVTATAQEGSTNITVSYAGESDTCRVDVANIVEYVVDFYESYDALKNDQNGENKYSSVPVTKGESINNVPVFGSGKGYDITWMDDNGSPQDKSDDKEFDVTAPITDNHTVYAEITIVPVATNLDLSIDENSNIIKTSDREYYIQPGTKFKMNATPSRDDGHFDEIKDNPEYTKYKNDITWYTSNADVASVDPKTGEVTMHKTGKAEISARMYENTPKYQRHSVLSSPLRVSNLEKEVNRDGIIINTQVGLKAEKGRFEELSGTEKAVRFIGYINEDFFPYITAAQFKVEAINDEGRVQKTFEYTATSFSRKITYYSKTPSQAYFKPWEQAGKVGTAFTITRLPDQEFIGQFKATFIVTDGVSEISVPCQSSVNYRGV